MIERYSRPEMAEIWSMETKFKKWLDVEIAACRAHVQLGNIQESDLKEIESKAKFDVARINEIEAEVHHDVIAFLTNLAEHIGPASRFVHLGLTSSDVVDTAFCLQMIDAGNLILKRVEELLTTIKAQAFQYKNTLTMGRTHGVHAEPTTFGLKLTVWYEEFKRHKERLEAAIKTVSIGIVSGAVGNYAHMPPELEELVCKELNLTPSSCSTQILQRDRHAQFMTTLALIGGTLEKIAVEIRGLQKTEFNEVQEPFSDKQKGSSAMPHKKNPILSERITGIARVIRGYALTAMENQALWHERDISHSSAERIIFPDATIVLDYAFGLAQKVLGGLVVNEEQMMENINRSYQVFFSQQLLLALVESGMLREDAYRVVQENALSAFKDRVLFGEKIQSDPRITERVSKSQLDQIFSFDKYTKHVDTIFKRVYGN